MSDDDNVDWKDSIPQQLRDAPYFKSAENIDQVVADLTNAAQYQGNSIRIPGPDAGEEDWNKFDSKIAEKVPNMVRADLDSDEGRAAMMKRLGQPDTPEDYGDAGDAAWLTKSAHEAGLTKAQFTKLIESVNGVNEAQTTEQKEKAQQAVDALRGEWGLAFPKKIDQVIGMLKMSEAPESLIEAMSGELPNTEMLAWLDGMAQKFADASNFQDDRSDETRITPDEAKIQIEELLRNPDFGSTGAIGQGLQRKMLKLQAVVAGVDPNDY